jgi:hypothetical protein
MAKFEGNEVEKEQRQQAIRRYMLFSPLMKLESFLEVKYNDRSEGDLLWLNDIQKSSKNKCY